MEMYAFGAERDRALGGGAKIFKLFSWVIMALMIHAGLYRKILLLKILHLRIWEVIQNLINYEVLIFQLGELG